MDVRINDGDLALLPNGDYERIGGIDEAVQRVRMVVMTNRGEFIYNRSLGVDYDAFSLIEEDAVGRLDMLIKEAAADIGGVRTEVVAFDKETMTIGIRVTYNGRSAVTEVDISGII